MGIKNQGATAPPNDETPLERFSKALAERFPGRVIKRYTMPASVRECREVFILEVTSREERDAAIFADTIMSNAERTSYKLANEAERRELCRLSIVGIGDRQDGMTGGIGYRHTNTNKAEPLGEITDWSSRAWAPLLRYFSEVNGVPAEEIDEGIKGAQLVGAFYAPKQETQASAAIGRSDGSSGAST